MQKLTTVLIDKFWKAGPATPGKPDLHSDGGGLYLKVTSARAASWVFRYRWNGRRPEMGLGGYPALGLAEAREKARELHRLVHLDKIDPLAQRKSERLINKARAKQPNTVRELWEEYLKIKCSAVVKTTTYGYDLLVKKYVLPSIGDIPFHQVDRSLIKRVLEPIWKDKPGSAREIKSILVQLFDYAAVYDDDKRPVRANPVRHIQQSLGKLTERSHHKALPYEDMPEFMAKLRKFKNRSGSSYRGDVDRTAIIAARNNGMSFAKIAQKFGIPWGTARWIGTYQKTRFIDHSIVRARALEFLILTGPPRSGEVLHTRWSEIDWDQKILTIPRKRMKVKAGEAGHIIPLTKRALEVLQEMQALNDGSSDYVFFGSTQGRSLREREALTAEHPGVAGFPLARTALNVFLRHKLKCDVTVHGFRSTFTDWAYNCGRFREIAIEVSLDHRYGSQTHRAYRRTQLVDERRELLECWANYCNGREAEVI